MNPSIALQFRPAQIEDPSAQAARFLTLRDMAQMGQLRGQQLQAGALENRQRETALNEDEAVKRVFAAGHTDPNVLGAELQKVSPRAYQAYAKFQADQQKAGLERRETLGKVNKVEWENKAAQFDRAAQTLGAVTDDQSFRLAIDTGEREGWMSPEEAAAARAKQWNPQTQNEVRFYARKALSVKDQIEAGLKESQGVRDAAEHVAKLPGIKADSQLKADTAAGNAPVQPIDRLRLDQQAERDANSAAYQRGMLGVARGNAAETKRYHDLSLAAAQGKVTADVRAKVRAIDNLEGSIKTYRDVLNKTGPLLRSDTPEAAGLQTKFTDLQMQLKNLYELGAITGPDLDLLNRAVTDPVGVGGKWKGKETLLAQLEALDSAVARTKNNLASSYVQQGSTNKANAAGTALQELSNDQLFRMLLNNGTGQ